MIDQHGNKSLTKQELLAALQSLPDDCRLLSTTLGNLALLDGNGEYAGFVDFLDGGVYLDALEGPESSLRLHEATDPRYRLSPESLSLVQSAIDKASESR